MTYGSEGGWQAALSSPAAGVSGTLAPPRMLPARLSLSSRRLNRMPARYRYSLLLHAIATCAVPPTIAVTSAGFPCAACLAGRERCILATCHSVCVFAAKRSFVIVMILFYFYRVNLFITHFTHTHTRKRVAMARNGVGISFGITLAATAAVKHYFGQQ